MTDTVSNLPDGPAAVVPPTRRQLMMLASDMGMASIDEAVMKFALAALARWGYPTLQPVAASRPVTLATVGEDFYRNSPMARAAVCASISEAELIRNLLENERRLTELVTDALHRAAPRTLMVHQSPAHLVLKPSPELMEGFEASLQPGRIKRLPAAAPAVVPVAVSERLPEPDVKVLAHYVNDLGKGRTVCAIWVPAKTRSDSDGDYDFTEYDEEDDTFYWPEGWYEAIENCDDWDWVKVDEGEVVYWQPLPKWPAHALPLPSGEVEG